MASFDYQIEYQVSYETKGNRFDFFMIVNKLND